MAIEAIDGGWRLLQHRCDRHLLLQRRCRTGMGRIYTSIQTFTTSLYISLSRWISYKLLRSDIRVWYVKIVQAMLDDFGHDSDIVNEIMSCAVTASSI